MPYARRHRDALRDPKRAFFSTSPSLAPPPSPCRACSRGGGGCSVVRLRRCSSELSSKQESVRRAEGGRESGCFLTLFQWQPKGPGLSQQGFVPCWLHNTGSLVLCVFAWKQVPGGSRGLSTKRADKATAQPLQLTPRPMPPTRPSRAEYL